MKKILFSCACCLLAVGLLAGCDEDVEDVTPEDPNAGVVESGGDDGEGGEDKGTETTYKLGVLNENLYSYYYFDGTLDGRFASGTDEWDKGVSLTVTTSEEGSTLSWEEEGVTYYLGYGVNDSNQNIVTITTEVSYLVINEEHDSIEDPSGKYFLGTYNEYTTFSWNGVSYYDEDFVAHLYTSAQTNPIAPAAPEPTGEMVEVETGVLGLYQGNKGNYYYFTGEINSSNFGVLSTDFTKAIEVTEWKDDAYYYLTIGSGESFQYIACPATSAARMSLTSEPYCLLVDETTGAFVTGDGKEFLGTYRDFETMSWSDVSYLGQEGQFIATIYKEEQKLPAPEAGSITISGATSVYVDSTITLTAVIPSGYDPSVEWSIDNSGYATIEESSGLTCVVKGVSEGDATVTVKSTANPEAYATTTISVEPVPAGLIGTFDFTSCTSSATAITESDDLDEYWTEAGSNGLYLGVRQHESVYLGNGSGGQFNGVSTLIKLGTTSGDGLLQLKFALGTNVGKVVLTAHSWNTSSANQLSVNGVSKNCSTSGSAEELVYEFDGTDAYLLTFESTLCVTIHSIEIYGTYDASAVKSITSLTLTSDTDGESLNVGSDCHITVSWEPTDTVFDIDELEWVSSNEEVATVTQTVNGATVHAVGTGTTTITATSLNGIVGTIEEIEVIDVLESSETFTMSDIYTDGDTPTLLSGHQVNITFAKSGNESAPQYYANGTALRLYKGNTVTFTGTYENAPITSVVITYTSGYAGTITVTNGTYTKDDSAYTYTLVPTQGATDMVMTYSENGRISQITVNYTLACD